MKKILFTVVVFIITQVNIFAQGTSAKTVSTAYLQAMQANLKILDTASTSSTLRMIANNFERIGKAEKDKWEPFYYAAYCTALQAVQADKAAIDELADKADSYLQQAVAVQDNSENAALAGMITASRIMVDPMSRFMVKGPEAAAFLEKAKQLDPANPRPYFLQAKTQIRTPEAMGGGKQVAKGSLEKAVEKYAVWTSTNPLAPSWGKTQAQAMLNTLNQQQ